MSVPIRHTASDTIGGMEQDTTLVADVDDAGTESHDDPQIVDELLIEEISIDGMCGVY